MRNRSGKGAEKKKYTRALLVFVGRAAFTPLPSGGRSPRKRGVGVVVYVLEQLVVSLLVHERALHSIVVRARHLQQARWQRRHKREANSDNRRPRIADSPCNKSCRYRCLVMSWLWLWLLLISLWLLLLLLLRRSERCCTVAVSRNIATVHSV